MNYPNFFVLGFTRCGSSSIHNYLNQHPEIFMSKDKELSYFNDDRLYLEKQGRYLDNFVGRKEAILGESTPMYAESVHYDLHGNLTIDFNDSPISRIKEFNPHSKILISIRSPMDRYMSIYEKNLYEGARGIVGSIYDQIDIDLGRSNEYNLIFKNNYRQHLQGILTQFSGDSVKILIFEEWVNAPEKCFNEVFEWLEVSTELDIPIEFEVHNKREGFKSLKYKLKRLLSSNRRIFIPKMKPYDPQRVKEILYPVFKEDILFVENLLGKRIDTWHI